jgi:hypothetical protein
LKIETDHKLEIFAENEIHLVASNEIKIGKENLEPAVLGNKFQDFEEKLIDLISKIQVPTGMGPSGIPINTPQFNQLKLTIKDTLSKLITIQ